MLLQGQRGLELLDLGLLLQLQPHHLLHTLLCRPLLTLPRPSLLQLHVLYILEVVVLDPTTTLLLAMGRLRHSFPQSSLVFLGFKPA